MGRSNSTWKNISAQHSIWEFDGIKPYRVKDTITISGYIKAYAGNAVDNAKLTLQCRAVGIPSHTLLVFGKRDALIQARKKSPTVSS